MKDCGSTMKCCCITNDIIWTKWLVRRRAQEVAALLGAAMTRG